MKTYVNDWFIGRLHESIEEAFYDFQNANDIENDDISPYMNDELSDAVNNLLNVMNECMKWQVQNNTVSSTKEEKTYFAFVLAYDLLHDMFAESSISESDITFNFCNILANEFVKSEEYKDMRYSAYDALQNWVNNNEDYIREKHNMMA